MGNSELGRFRPHGRLRLAMGDMLRAHIRESGHALAKKRGGDPDRAAWGEMFCGPPAPYPLDDNPPGATEAELVEKYLAGRSAYEVSVPDPAAAWRAFRDGDLFCGPVLVDHGPLVDLVLARRVEIAPDKD